MRVIAMLALPLASTLLIAAAVLEAQQNPGSASNAPTRLLQTLRPRPRVMWKTERRSTRATGATSAMATPLKVARGARLAPRPIAFAAFARYVRRPTGQMPPYTGKVVSDQELADIYAFLLTIPPPPAVDTIPILAR